MPRVKFLIVLVLFLSGCIGVERAVKKRPGEPVVRVLLGSGGRLKSEGRLYIHKDSKVYRLSPGSIEITKGGIYRGTQKIFDITSPTRVSFEENVFEYKGLIYRGEVILVDSLIINRIPMEQYLYSVVACEFGCGEIEAMKAGACAARTYALIRLNTDKSYDLLATQSHQVYKGQGAETENSISACDYTRGLVCEYKGKPIDAMYSSTCGGKTANVEDVFGEEKPYLKSRRCEYCEISPHYRWTNKYSKQNFFELLRYSIKSIKGKDPGSIKGFKIEKRDKSERVKEVVVNAKEGDFRIKGTTIRKLLGLKSRYFFVKSSGQFVYIEGRGWGHGVGMCSWGAIGMSKKGKNFQQILKYYYKGININRLY